MSESATANRSLAMTCPTTRPGPRRSYSSQGLCLAGGGSQIRSYTFCNSRSFAISSRGVTLAYFASVGLEKLYRLTFGAEMIRFTDFLHRGHVARGGPLIPCPTS